MPLLTWAIKVILAVAIILIRFAQVIKSMKIILALRFDAVH
jgi:hypothetical protein